MRQTPNPMQRRAMESDDLSLILAGVSPSAAKKRRRARLPAGGGLAALLAMAGAEASDDSSFRDTDLSGAEDGYRTAESAADLFDFAAICETALEGVFAFAHDHDGAAHGGHLGDAFLSPFAAPFGGLAAHAGGHADAPTGAHGSAAAGHDAGGAAASGHGAHEAHGDVKTAHGGAHDAHHGGDGAASHARASMEGHAEGAPDAHGDRHAAMPSAGGGAHSGHGAPDVSGGGVVSGPSSHAYHDHSLDGLNGDGDLDEALNALLGADTVAGDAAVPASPAAQSFAHADHEPPEVITPAGVDI